MSAQNCIRSSLIIVNIFFLVAGLALLGLGIWVQVEKGDYVALADSDTGLTGAILLIVGGAVTAVISFLGVLGAIKRSVILLWIFFSVLMIIVIVQLVALVLAFVYREKIEDELYDDMKKTILEYDVDGVEGVTKAWNWAQQKFECCGVDSFRDWRTSITNFNPGGLHNIVPDSCCKEESEGCGNFSPNPEIEAAEESEIYTTGCFEEVKDFIKDHLLTIGLAALFFLIFELIVMVLTVMMALSITRDSNVV